MLPVPHRDHLLLFYDCPKIDVLKGDSRLVLAETAKNDAEKHGSHISFLQDKPQAGTIVAKLWLTVAVSLRRDERSGNNIPVGQFVILLRM